MNGDFCSAMHQKGFFLNADLSTGIDQLDLFFAGGFHMAVVFIIDTQSVTSLINIRLPAEPDTLPILSIYYCSKILLLASQ